MKINWDFVSLGSVTQIYNGNSINAEYKKKHFLGVDKGYPFIATKDVGFNGFIDYENGMWKIKNGSHMWNRANIKIG